jgi:uncharacterized protein YrrD
MKYATDIIGLPVVSHETGERSYQVKDLLFDEDQHNVLGLLVEEGGWLSKSLAVPFSAVTSIGPDAVIIPSEKSVIETDGDERLAAATRRSVAVKGKQVMSEDGKDLGKIADLVIDQESGHVDGYLISGGIFADVYKGQPFIPAPLMLKVGEDVVFVPAETVRELEEQVHGLQGAAQRASEQVQDVASRTSEQVQETAKTAADRARESASEAGKRIRETGHQASERLKETGHDLSQRANEGRQQAARYYEELRKDQRPGEQLDRASSEVRDRTERLKESANEFWDDVKDRASSLRGDITNRVEEERVKRAIGRPVNRVILAPGDDIILQAGEIITWQAVEKARGTGVLDMLLMSVSNQQPPKQQPQRPFRPAEQQ